MLFNRKIIDIDHNFSDLFAFKKKFMFNGRWFLVLYDEVPSDIWTEENIAGKLPFHYI
jgi:hypothetical protein